MCFQLYSDTIWTGIFANHKSIFGSSQRKAVDFAYKNLGKTPAIIKQTAFHHGIEPIGDDPSQIRGRPEINAEFSNIQAQAASRAWVLQDGESSEIVTQVLNMPSFPQGLPSHVQEMIDAQFSTYSDAPTNIFLRDRIVYADLIGNEYILSVEYQWDGHNFVVIENSETQKKSLSR